MGNVKQSNLRYKYFLFFSLSLLLSSNVFSAFKDLESDEKIKVLLQQSEKFKSNFDLARALNTLERAKKLISESTPKDLSEKVYTSYANTFDTFVWPNGKPSEVFPAKRSKGKRVSEVVEEREEEPQTQRRRGFFSFRGKSSSKRGNNKGRSRGRESVASNRGDRSNTQTTQESNETKGPMDIRGGFLDKSPEKANLDMYVLSYTLPMYMDSNARSEVLVEKMPFGAKVILKGYHKFYQLPKQARRDRGPYSKIDKNVVPVWAEIEYDNKIGYVAYRSLVTEKELDKQRPDRAKAKAASSDVSALNRGFSDDEEEELAVMKGAAGSAKAGQSDYGKLDGYLKEYQSSRPSVPELQIFMEKGELDQRELVANLDFKQTHSHASKDENDNVESEHKHESTSAAMESKEEKGKQKNNSNTSDEHVSSEPQQKKKKGFFSFFKSSKSNDQNSSVSRNTRRSRGRNSRNNRRGKVDVNQNQSSKGHQKSSTTESPSESEDETPMDITGGLIEKESVKENLDMYILSHKLKMYSDPDPYSEIVINKLPFGAKVLLKGYHKFYKLPKQARRDRGPYSKIDKTIIPVWAEIEFEGQTGYVSYRSIVSEKELDKQKPERAKAKMSGSDVSALNKSFSEEEEEELAVMKGAAGSEAAGKSDYGKLDKYLKGYHGTEPTYEELKEFIEEGK
jgi:hypothetical protein